MIDPLVEKRLSWLVVAYLREVAEAMVTASTQRVGLTSLQMLDWGIVSLLLHLINLLLMSGIS
ncbi:MAG: hypothetical protein WA919_07505 [Coleofasciculaceae cyanobacterium]